MNFKVFRSGSGDCVLLTSAGGTRLLADAGVPPAYKEHIAGELAKLREQGHTIDVAYISHSDRDHIGGILGMLDSEMAWKIYDHMKSKGRRWKKPKSPRPPETLAIWHNAFLETIAKTKAVPLGTAGITDCLSRSANALSAINGAGFGTSSSVDAAAETQLLALSIGDAIEVNWRIQKNQLAIALNPQFGGKFMVQNDRIGHFELGDLTVTVLGPTATELKEFRESWIKWLRKNSAQRSRLRRQHRKDIDRLKSDTGNVSSAIETQEHAHAIEKDVTPPNLASMVLLVEEGQRRILLTGDAGDQTLLKYIKDVGLFDNNGVVEFDVLKVPHHGAHNSYSPEFVRRVRARNYVFCGDGEHDNPELDVVEGYIDANSGAAARGDRESVHFWFNCSSTVEKKHRRHWEALEKLFDRPALDRRIKVHFLQTGNYLTVPIR